MIQLYPFQSRGLEDGRAAFGRGRRAVLFVGPTGMGKTTLAAFAAKGRVERGGTVVAFAHRVELVDQMAARFRSVGLEVAVNSPDRKAQAHVMMVQTALARRAIPDADFGIIDEGHHYVSDEWSLPVREMLARGARIMGLTATPWRDGDGRALGIGEGGIFDELVTVAQVADLISLNAAEHDKGITPIEVWEPEMHVRKLAAAPVDSYLDQAPGRYAVVFSPNVKTAEVFLADFRRANVSSGLVHGDMPKAEREVTLSRFARGEIKVLVNVNVLTEGWDAPICDVCILARKIGALSLLIQCIGRARRPHHHGKVALLLDLSGNLEMHGFHPDDELEYSLEGEPVRGRGAKAETPRICRKCKRVLVDDIAEAKARGLELERCPECLTKLSKIVVPTPEEVALRKAERGASLAKVPTDKRTKALATLYSNGLREGRSRKQAETIYRRMFRRHPDTEVRVSAWRVATQRVASEKGDAWEPPEEKAS